MTTGVDTPMVVTTADRLDLGFMVQADPVAKTFVRLVIGVQAQDADPLPDALGSHVAASITAAAARVLGNRLHEAAEKAEANA